MSRDVRIFAYIFEFTFVSFNYVCWFVHVGTGARRGQKRASDSLGLELKAVVCHLVGCGNGIRVLCKSRCAFNPEPSLQKHGDF